MIPWILGAAIGASLALANFCASIALSSRAIKSSKGVSIAFILGAFFMRLILLFLAFYFLARVEIIRLPPTLLTFIVCFTILVFWEMRIYYRKTRLSGGLTPPRVRAG